MPVTHKKDGYFLSNEAFDSLNAPNDVVRRLADALTSADQRVAGIMLMRLSNAACATLHNARPMDDPEKPLPAPAPTLTLPEGVVVTRHTYPVRNSNDVVVQFEVFGSDGRSYWYKPSHPLFGLLDQFLGDRKVARA